jgi:hypothetical protein
MSSQNGNVKWWQLVSVAVALFGVMVTLSIFFASNVIANDRLRAAGDEYLREKIECLLKDNMNQHMIIVRDLQEIKTRMGIKNGS